MDVNQLMFIFCSIDAKLLAEMFVVYNLLTLEATPLRVRLTVLDKSKKCARVVLIMCRGLRNRVQFRFKFRIYNWSAINKSHRLGKI
ncbi:unnamed protein product, partial [Dicrocoelium dendriticum]